MFAWVLFALLTIAILVLVIVAYVKSTKKSGHKKRSKGGYAVLSNQAGATTGTAAIDFAATPAGNLSTGMTLTGGILTLPLGTYIVEYSVRLTHSPEAGTFVAIAQLQQGGADITQPAISTLTLVDTVTAVTPDTESQITGFALIQVTSTSNNTLNLNLTIPAGSNIALIAATGTDANAQMTVFSVSSH